MQREVSDLPIDSAQLYRSVIANHPLFANWPQETLNRFSKLWSVILFEPGEKIVKEGNQVDSVYFVVDGECEVIRHAQGNPQKTQTLAVLTKGESIGLSTTGLFSETNERTATVIALSPVKTIKLNLKTLQTFLYQHVNLNTSFENAVSRVFKLQLAKQCVPFARLPAEKIVALADKIDEVEVSAGEVIFREGDPVEDCYLIATGKVQINKQEVKGPYELATLGPGSIFGEMAVIFNIPRSATAIAIEESKLYRLRRLDLLDLFATDLVFASQLSALMLDRSRPEQVTNVQERHEFNSDKSLRVVLKNLNNNELYILNERSYFAWKLMDSRNSIAAISAALKNRYGEDATYELVILVSDLNNHGFITVLGYRFPSKNKKSFWNRLTDAFK